MLGSCAMCAFGISKNVSSPFVVPSFDVLFAAAVSALAGRSLSETELRRLLKRKISRKNAPTKRAKTPEPEPKAEPEQKTTHIIDALISQVVVRLRELGYLSDERLAQHFVEIRQKQAHLGRRRVAQELHRKGVSSDLVSSTIEQAYSGVDEVALAQAFVEKKRLLRSLGDERPLPPKQTAKLLRTLVRAGFSQPTCWKVVRGLASAEALENADACDETGE